MITAIPADPITAMHFEKNVYLTFFEFMVQYGSKEPEIS
jgi:hypothetical protein